MGVVASIDESVRSDDGNPSEDAIATMASRRLQSGTSALPEGTHRQAMAKYKNILVIRKLVYGISGLIILLVEPLLAPPSGSIQRKVPI